MNAFLILLAAILFEVVGTSALKASNGFTRPGPSVLVVLGYGAAFYLLALSLRQIPLGIAYAIWSGVGTAGAVLIGVLVWREVLDLPRILGIGLIVAGVIILNLYSKTPAT